MKDLLIHSGEVVHKVFVYDGLGACCSEDPLAGGGMSSTQSSPQDLTVSEYNCEVPAKIVVERDGRVDVVVLIMPGVSEDLKIDVELVGEGAQANIYGAYVCGGEEKVKISVDMHHDMPHCNSRQLFKGIAGGNSRVDFYGKIIVAPDAQRTEAYQENHNILLSDDARVDTRPQLEIYADDVKCSHGATIGRLNEEEQFYMRSRGITLEEAKVLQMISFLAPVLENIQDNSERERLTEQLSDAIRTL